MIRHTVFYGEVQFDAWNWQTLVLIMNHSSEQMVKCNQKIERSKFTRIFNGCEVQIEKSVTRVTVRQHEACRVMPNSYWSDRTFNSHRWTILVSFSCIFFLRTLYLNFHMHYCINITLKYLHFRSRHDWFGFYLWCWRWNVWRQMTPISDVMTSKLMCDIKRTPWRHAWVSSCSPSVGPWSGLQEYSFSTYLWWYRTFNTTQLLDCRVTVISAGRTDDYNNLDLQTETKMCQLTKLLSKSSVSLSKLRI